MRAWPISNAYIVAPTIGGHSCGRSTCSNWAGVDLRPLPLGERKNRLRELLRRERDGMRYNEHLQGDGAQMFAHACDMGLEGIISKDRTRPYQSGPSKTWLKTKNPAAPGVLRFEDRDAPA
jgi:bifunctional non-homologous end joining protein LigD